MRCHGCGIDFVPRHPNHTKWCTPKCAARHQYRSKSGSPITDASRSASFRCEHCGGEYPVKRSGPLPRFCSKNCGQKWRYANRPDVRQKFKDNARHGKHTRRAAVRAGERFTIEYIFDRDRGRCHLCRRKVSLSEATMDHLVPLVLGGSHTKANVALACRSCNCSKRHRAMGEQLRLIG